MADILAIAEAGIRNGLRQLEAISTNVANINTQGYKREIYLNRGFQQYMADESGAPEMKTHDYSAGALKFTGSSLNVAIEGDGYFQVQSPQGTLLTRNGQFQIDGRGQLVSVEGWPVVLTAAATFDSADFNVRSDGTLEVAGEVQAQFDIVNADAASLEAAGPGLFRAIGTAPVAAASINLRQGYIEGSNVEPLTEMINLMTLTRQVESTQQLMRAYDDVLGSAINTLGEF